MKHLKKYAALLLSLIMVLSMASTALGASITITDSKGTAANGFAAYQIFTGDLDSTEHILSNLVWGENVTPVDGKVTINGTDYTAEEAAAALSATPQTLTADDLAKIVTGTPKTATAETKDGDAQITGLEDGYYLVMTNGTVANGEAATKYILQVIGNVTVVAKTDAPSIEKKVKNDDELDAEYRDTNNVAIGDIINYQLTSKVPDMSNYKQYYFIMTDTMSEGLDYVGNMVVMVGDQELNLNNAADATTGYALDVKTNDDGTTTLEIVFNNFIQYTKGDVVTVTYDAKLNDDCKINEVGNPNKVDLEYSNNPNEQGSGTNKPGEGDDNVTGKTPEDWTITYTTKMSILKIADDGKELANATFTFVGEKTNSTTTTREVFEENADGTYYKLNDGTYTEIAPTAQTEDSYDSTETKYILTKVSEVNEETETVFQKVTTDENGYADLGSLAEGTYTITELIAPDGYNLLDKPIHIEITCDSADVVELGNEEATWTVTQDGVVINEKGAFDEYIVEIINYAGATLPTTGGMGTTILYGLGSALVLFAGVLLISKRRMAH